jgi:class 3 adenylate cyclase
MVNSNNKNESDAAILFLDIKGYSDLSPVDAYSLHEIVINTLYQEIKQLCEKLEYRNSWGDGIVLIHTDPLILAAIAVKIQAFYGNEEEINRLLASRYEKGTLQKIAEEYELKNFSLQPRIALHFGKVFKIKDEFKEDKSSYYGPDIIETARIEPITPPGQIWVTNQFKSRCQPEVTEEAEAQETTEADTITLDNQTYQFLKIGKVPLAKKFGNRELWQLTKEGSLQEESQMEQDITQDIYQINMLFKTNFSYSTLTKCHINSTKDCNFQYHALSLVTELVRNTEAIQETRKFLFLNKALFARVIEFKALVYNEAYRKNDEGKDKLKTAARIAMKKVDSIYKFIKNLKWKENANNKDWEDFLGRFIERRLIATEDHDKSTYIKCLQQLRQGFEKTAQEIEIIELIKTARELNTSAISDYISHYPGYIENGLDILATKRLTKTKEVIKDKLFSKDQILQELPEKSFESLNALPHRTEEVPGIFPNLRPYTQAAQDE